MAFHVRDPETDRIVRALAAREGKTLTETIRDACADKLNAPDDDNRPLRDQLRDLASRLDGNTGLKADKAFYDLLSGDD